MKSFETIFENEDFIAVNKPSGMVVIPDRFGFEDLVLKELVEQKLNQPVWVVHRIDKPTSGLVLFAKNKESHAELNQLFLKRNIQKEYLAIVEGHVQEKTFTADFPLKQTSSGSRVIVSKDGKESTTYFEKDEEFRDYCVVRAYPKTGRTHQIRVHLSYMGTPILGDPLYGTKKMLYLSMLKKKNFKLAEETEEKPLMNRTALHAHKLHFKDKNGNEFHLEAPIPKDFKAVLNQLRKYNKIQEVFFA